MNKSKSLIDFSVVKKIKQSCLRKKWKHSVRKSPAYDVWRKKALARDGYRCQKCGRFKVRFQVHHVKGYTRFPQLRLKVENSITYCWKCHRKFHEKYGKQNFPDSRKVEW